MGGGDIGGSGQLCVGIAPGTGGSQSAGGTTGGAFATGGTTGLTGMTSQAGSGGGGGWYGGGASNGSGGGGGSSYVSPGMGAIMQMPGVRDGDGVITISW